jgi:hypothetical protein
MPEYAPIYAKLHVDPTPAPEAMLQDEEHFSRDMLALGLSWYAQSRDASSSSFANSAESLRTLQFWVSDGRMRARG